MVKLYSVFILLLLSTSVSAAQSDVPVYRWVDENGNVHFSDLPRVDGATLVTLKRGNLSDPEPIPQIDNNQLPNAGTNGGANATDENDTASELLPNNAEACLNLRVEINKVRRELGSNSGNSAMEKNAKAFLADAEKLLAQHQCQ